MGGNYEVLYGHSSIARYAISFTLRTKGMEKQSRLWLRQHQMDRYHDSREEGYIWNWADCDDLEFKGIRAEDVEDRN